MKHQIPTMPTAVREALRGPPKDAIVKDSDTGTVWQWNGAGWVVVPPNNKVWLVSVDPDSLDEISVFADKDTAYRATAAMAIELMRMHVSTGHPHTKESIEEITRLFDTGEFEEAINCYNENENAVEQLGSIQILGVDVKNEI